MQLMMQRKRQEMVKQSQQKAATSAPSTRDIHLQRDLAKLAGLPRTSELIFPDPKDLAHFNVILRPDEGIYAGGRFKFSVEVTPEYNMQPPKVHCLTPVFHPNIDSDGHVCLNILRDEWTPAYDLMAIIVGLLHLFYRPNPDDPLDREAADLMRKHPDEFKRRARRSFETR